MRMDGVQLMVIKITTLRSTTTELTARRNANQCQIDGAALLDHHLSKTHGYPVFQCALEAMPPTDDIMTRQGCPH